MFLGTPFKGSPKAGWADMARKFFDWFSTTNPADIQDLKEQSKEVRRISHEFEKFIKSRDKSRDELPINVACYFEELSMRNKLFVSVGKIVEAESACLAGIDPIGLDADHIQMCKYDSDERMGYRSISGILSGWISIFISPQPREKSKVS